MKVKYGWHLQKECDTTKEKIGYLPSN